MANHGAGLVAVADDFAEHGLVTEGFADQILANGLAREQDSVAAEQRDGTLVADVHRLEEVLEKPAFDTGQDEAERFAGTAPDLAGKVEGPGAGAAIPDRRAQVDVELRVGHVRLVVVAVRQVDFRRGIGAREIDDIPVERNDRGDVDLRHAAHLVAQHLEDFRRAHRAPQLLVIGDVGVFHPIGDALEDEVGGLHGLVRRFRQRDRHIGQVDLPFLDGGFPGAPQHEGRTKCNKHHGEHAPDDH